jgi:hypothetical protein
LKWNKPLPTFYMDFFFIFFFGSVGQTQEEQYLRGKGKKIWFWSKRNSIFLIQKLDDSKKILFSLCKNVLAPILSTFTLFFSLQHSLSCHSFCFLGIFKTNMIRSNIANLLPLRFFNFDHCGYLNFVSHKSFF